MRTLRSFRPDIAEEIAESLETHVLKPWFPASIDPRGGFHQNFARDWSKLPDASRSLVFQSRMTWFTATLVNEGRPDFKGCAEHGLRYLSDKMADGDAFFSEVDLEGRPIGQALKERNAYSLAFALFGLAAAARALGGGEALTLAQRLFGYLETAHFDAELGGYYEVSDLYGKPIYRTEDSAHWRLKYKSQNAHLHLLEAFTELYLAWPVPQVGLRLRQTRDIFLTGFYTEPGWLHMYLERDWSPVAGEITYGHDIEAAHLLLSAQDALGEPYEVVFEKARRLVDHSLGKGWDNENGGFYVFGNNAGATDLRKIWWVQAEALLALVRLAELTDESRYWEATEATWHWIRDVQIDREFGGWFGNLTREGQITDLNQKGHAWKAAYHDGRAMMRGKVKGQESRDKG